jgi:hypothetical protein
MPHALHASANNQQKVLRWNEGHSCTQQKWHTKKKCKKALGRGQFHPLQKSACTTLPQSCIPLSVNRQWCWVASWLSVGETAECNAPQIMRIAGPSILNTVSKWNTRTSPEPASGVHRILTIHFLTTACPFRCTPVSHPLVLHHPLCLCSP